MYRLSSIIFIYYRSRAVSSVHPDVVDEDGEQGLAGWIDQAPLYEDICSSSDMEIFTKSPVTESSDIFIN